MEMDPKAAQRRGSHVEIKATSSVGSTHHTAFVEAEFVDPSREIQ